MTHRTKKEKGPPGKRAYIVTVDMGYGHQRAAYPLNDIAACPFDCAHEDGYIISANTYPGIPRSDKRKWESSRKLYETISRMKKIPIIGDWFFGAMNYFQRIEPFYPKRDLSAPIVQVRQIYRLIRAGWGKHLIDSLNENPLPLITSFFTIAFFAEEHGYNGDIYCICTDTDVSRAWAPLEQKKTRIKYLSPNKRVRERLKLYGIHPDQIFVTGFPLPKENIGGKTLHVLKQSLGCRISNLDPHDKYQTKYAHTLEYYLGERYCYLPAGHPLTITFSVGGAGAQKDIGVTILESLHDFIDKGTLRLNLVAGVRNDVYTYYDSMVRELHLEHRHGGTINILYAENKMEYFRQFNQMLLTTDILWTKPIELSFYSGLGIPIIMAPTVGSQEEFNKAWLHAVGAGFEQEDPRYAHEWLFDWLEAGWFAQTH